MKLEDLAESIDERILPFLDRSDVDLSSLTEDQCFWREHGYLIQRNFLSHSLIDAYVEARKNHEEWPGQPTSYMDSPEMRDLCLHHPLTEKLRELMGIEMAVNLVLCGWRSSERDWHQDSYLSPFFDVGGYTIAVWIALEDIHPDAGPFQLIPGSHRWPVVSHDKIREALSKSERMSPAWPRYSERVLTGIFEKRIREEAWQVKEFAPASKGDVLIWHTFLAHRGSVPKDPGRTRKSLIAHYSGIGKRSFFPSAVQHKDQGWYYPLSYPAYKIPDPPTRPSGPRGRRLRQWAKKIPGIAHLWRRLRARFL